jgi:hypothetical protein
MYRNFSPDCGLILAKAELMRLRPRAELDFKYAGLQRLETTFKEP